MISLSTTVNVNEENFVMSLNLNMMIAGQVGKWEEFFAFHLLQLPFPQSAKVQIGGGQTWIENWNFKVFGCIACEDVVKHSQNLLPSHSWHSGKKGMPNQPNWKTNRNPSYWHLTGHRFLKEFDMCLFTSHHWKWILKIRIFYLSPASK